MNRPARPLVESALLAALGAVFIFISFYVPFAGILATVVSPLPAAFVVIRHGIRWGLLSSVVTLLVLLPLVSPLTAIGLWAVYGAMGVALGHSVRKHLSPERTIALMAGASMIGTVANFVGAFFATGLTLTKLADQTVQAFEFALKTNQKLLGPNPMLDQMAKSFTREFFLRALPSSFVLASLLTAWINFEIIRRILPRFGYSMESLRPFSQWIMPEVLGHAWVLSALAYWLQRSYAEKFPVALLIVENVFGAASMFMVLDVVAVLSFYVLRTGLPRVISGLIVFMALSMIFGSPVLALYADIFGMIDVLFDLRKLRYPELRDA